MEVHAYLVVALDSIDTVCLGADKACANTKTIYDS